MKRVNTFEVVPQTKNDKECLLRLLDASASLWNELTYERRQNSFRDGDVWDTSEYQRRYNSVIGSATVFNRSRAKTPNRGDHEETIRHGDTLTCSCGFEGHADLTASETFLRENSDPEVRPMARSVRFEWDDHDWSEKPHPHESPKEVRTNPQVCSVVQ